MPPAQRVQTSLAFLQDWLEANALCPSIPSGTVSSENSAKWERPPPGFLKCKIDAAVNTQGQSIKVWMVLRNEYGDVVACQSKYVRGILPPNEAEGIALREAILWLNRLHVTEVIIEMDAKQVYEAVLSLVHGRYEFGYLFTIRHVKMCANSVAYALAKVSCITPG